LVASSIRSKVIDDISYSIVDMYLKNHSFPVLEIRLLSSLKGELDSINVLRDVWLEQMGGSPERLIEVYEKTNDRNETQHYENLIDSTLMTFVAEFFIALLAGIVVEQYSKNRDKILRVIKRLYRKPVCQIMDATNEVTAKYDKSIRYLFQVYALKEYCERKHLPQAEFIRLRECMRQTIYSGKKEPLTAEFTQFYKVFLENHLIPSLEQSFAQKMGVEFVTMSLETNFDNYVRAMASEKTKDLGSNVGSNLVFEKKLQGISAGKRGNAIGPVTVVIVESDCEKVRKGDVMAVDEMCPDFVPAAKLAVALVSNRGGITSHTAIISRALNIPAVVGTGKATEILKNGLIAMVDSNHGIVSISV
jgi:phosphohistidine swiveling domain-containing protein